MKSVQRVLSLLIPLALVLALVVPVMGGPGVQACSKTVQGPIILPSGDSAPPSSRRVQSVNAYATSKIDPGGFNLGPAAGTATSTILSMTFPDFNVVWYDTYDALVGSNDDPGPDSGTVPTNADYAVVWMAYGPDFGNSDGAFPAAKFELRTGC